MRRLTDEQRNILRLLADGWDLVTECPEPGRESSCLRSPDDAPDVPVAAYDLHMLRKPPRLIRHHWTDAANRRLYSVLTPAGRRAVEGRAAQPQ